MGGEVVRNWEEQRQGKIQSEYIMWEKYISSKKEKIIQSKKEKKLERLGCADFPPFRANFDMEMKPFHHFPPSLSSFLISSFPEILQPMTLYDNALIYEASCLMHTVCPLQSTTNSAGVRCEVTWMPRCQHLTLLRFQELLTTVPDMVDMKQNSDE